MNKQMNKINKRKILGISLDTLLIFGMFMTEDIHFLKFIGILAVIILAVDTLICKL